MQIKLVTLTGADDSVHPANLAVISAVYPFAEWGILFSNGAAAKPRFPSEIWIRAFANAAQQHKMKASAHLCQGYASDLLHNADFSWKRRHPHLYKTFQRVQLNFYGMDITPHPRFLDVLKEEGQHKTFIFQLDGRCDHLFHQALSLGINVVGLYDHSAGHGVYPDTWPMAVPLAHKASGYAGGLTPENIESELTRIHHVANGHDIWIDAESGLRNPENPKQFDVGRARQFVGRAGRFSVPRP